MKRATRSQEVLSVSDSIKLQNYEDLADKLECVVCYEFPQTFDDKGIESCKGGHILCGDCKDRFRTQPELDITFQFECPVCKVHFSLCKNQFATAYTTAKYKGIQIN